MQELPENISRNIDDVLAELKWLEKVIRGRILKERLAGITKEGDIYQIPQPPSLESSDSPFATFVKENELGTEERMLLIISLAHHLKPEVWEQLVVPRMINGMESSSEISNVNKCLIGTRGEGFKGMLPSGLTYLYLLAGPELKERMRLQYLLSNSHILIQKGVLMLEPHLKGEPIFSGRLSISEDYLERFTVGESDKEASVKYSVLNGQDN